jgi:hypothetical protein
MLNARFEKDLVESECLRNNGRFKEQPIPDDPGKDFRLQAAQLDLIGVKRLYDDIIKHSINAKPFLIWVEEVIDG